MSETLTYTLNETQLADIQNRLSRLSYDDANGAIQKMLVAAATATEDRLKQNVSNDILKVRTGNLRNSLQSRVDMINGKWTASVGSGVRTGGRVPYANILETGGTITPVTKQFLAIPIGDALTPTGVAKFTPTELKDGQATGYAGSVIIGGIIFGIANLKSRSQITPLFVLKRSVEIPAKLYMNITLDEMTPDIMGIMTDTLNKALSNE